jgi:ubiquinone/menaquinone biosynthesis C-methylase UbiE
MSKDDKGLEGGNTGGSRARTESAWHGESGVGSLHMLETVRLFASRALAKLVKQVLAPYNLEGTSTVEVGSGMGFLREMVPSWKGDWMQVEPAEALLRNAKKRAEHRPRKDGFVVGSAYELPIKSGSQNLVAGLASYDVMDRLDEAVAETMRVLKPGGTFIHFLDFRAPASPLIKMFEKAGIPFEYIESASPQEPSMLKVETTNPAHRSILDLLVFEEGSSKGMRRVDMNPTFEKLLTRSLLQHGFKIISTGKQTEIVSGPRLGIQRDYPEVIRFTLDAGEVIASVSTRKPLPGLPTMTGIEEEARVDVIIAEKPQE